MSYFGVSLRNGVGLGLGTVPSLTNTPLSYRLAPSLDLSFAGSDTLSPAITFSRTTNATLTNSAGLIANAPMNLLTFSEQFDNAAWTKSNSTITANSAVAPDGASTADKLVENTANAEHRVLISSAVVVPTNSPSTVSLYAKAAERTAIRLTDNDIQGADVDLLTGTVSNLGAGVTATATSVGNGWWRVAVTRTSSTANGRLVAYLVSGGSTTYTGNGVSGIFIWGAQLEAGSTATTYNPTTVKNLLGFTEHFDNAAWTKSNASITSGFTDIYGQPFAQKLVEDTNTSEHKVVQNVSAVSGTAYTFSIYAKADERSVVSFYGAGGLGSLGGSVNLATGVILSGSASVVAVGNGWWRVSGLGTSTFTGVNSVTVRINNTSYTGDGTSGIYIFGAQLSDSASVDPYVYQPVAAPSSVAYYGPRFDYDPVTLAPKGLLIEEQRTNLVIRSEEFDTATWFKTDATVTANATTSPDGTVDAEKLIVSSGLASGVAGQSVTKAASAIQYTWSVYAKAGEWNSVGVYLSGSSFNNRGAVIVNLATGAISTAANVAGTFTGASATVTDAGNGWYRIALTVTSNTDVAVVSRVYPANNGAFPNGDGTSGIYIWGAQLEAGAFATSYIPTVASQVTRAADSASMIGNNFARWYTPSAGSFLVEFDTANPAGVGYLYSANAAGAIGNSIFQSVFSNTTDNYVLSGGVQQVRLLTGTISANTAAKTSIAYANANFSAVTNGGSPQTQFTGLLPIGVDRLNLGYSAGGANYLNGHSKRFAFYSRKLSPVEQQGITS